MDIATKEQYEQQITELATFCFRKVANLEARFIVLCHRAQAAGIECLDLCEGYVATEQEPDEPLRVVN
ncbi:MAG: hypothetical protein ACT443_15380 [Gemmatimonadota bacterium]